MRAIVWDMTTEAVLNQGFIPEWTFADRLRKARLASGLTQEEFAEQLGAKPGAYSHWEAGRNTPRNLVALAQRIEMLVGIPAAWTLGIMNDVPDNGGPGTRSPKLKPVSERKPLDYKVGDSAEEESNVHQFPFRRQHDADFPLEYAA